MSWKMISEYEKFWAAQKPANERTPEETAELIREDRRRFGALSEGPGAEKFHAWCAATNSMDVDASTSCENFHTMWHQRKMGFAELDVNQFRRFGNLMDAYNKAKAAHAAAKCPHCGRQERRWPYWI